MTPNNFPCPGCNNSRNRDAETCPVCGRSTAEVRDFRAWEAEARGYFR